MGNDKDIEHLHRDELKAEIRRLRHHVREHRDFKINNRALYAVLPEGCVDTYAPPPSWPVDGHAAPNPTQTPPVDPVAPTGLVGACGMRWHAADCDCAGWGGDR